MKYADKLNAKYIIIIGDNEVQEGIGKLKDMSTGEEVELPLDKFVSAYYNITLSSQLDDLEINGEEFDFSSLFGLKKDNEE
jgi:histidyl-tRNA synthetase